MTTRPKYPGERITANGNQLVSCHTEARIADGGIFYPITPSTEGGELYQQSFAEGRLNVFGRNTLAVEAEGEHAAQGGAIAYSVCGRRVVNFTSGQGIVYAMEQYYHAPGKASTMVVEVVARALTKHALNVHCGHDDIYGALDVGWIILFAKDAQQAADQALILRRVNELSLTPGMNVQDGFLTSHLERTFYRHESELLREFLGAPEDIIECPTESQRTLFGPTRRRVPRMIDLTNPVLLGPVQNQEHYMQGVVARRNNFVEPILTFLEDAYEEFGRLTGRYYGLVTQYKTDDADTVFLSLGSAAENCEAAVDHLRRTRGSKVGSVHLNVFRPFPERAVVEALAGKRNVIILERTDEPMAGDNPMGRDTRTALNKALKVNGRPVERGLPQVAPDRMPRLFNGIYGLGSRDFRPEQIIGAYEYATGERARTDGRTAAWWSHGSWTSTCPACAKRTPRWLSALASRRCQPKSPVAWSSRPWRLRAAALSRNASKASGAWVCKHGFRRPDPGLGVPVQAPFVRMAWWVSCRNLSSGFRSRPSVCMRAGSAVQDKTLRRRRHRPAEGCLS